MLNRFKSSFDTQNFLVPILAVVFGFLLGAIIMIATGFNPVQGYAAMMSSAWGKPFFAGETIARAIPLIFTALGFAVAMSAGFFNIGLSGQALAGWIFSVWVVFAFQGLPSIILIPLAIIIGAFAGAIAAGIPGALRAFFGTSEVITTIMLNYVYLFLSTFMLRTFFKEEWMRNVDVTLPMPENGRITSTLLQSLTNGSRLNNGLWLALVALVLVWFMMKKTTTGFEIRAVGLNPTASEYAGISSKRTIVISMMISGALAGLGGVVTGIGYFLNFTNQVSSLDIGFNGLAVSLLGNNSPFGILFASLLFSTLAAGSSGMQALTIPAEIASIVQASIIFFVGANWMIRFFLDKMKKDKTQVAVEVAAVNKKTAPSQDSNKGGEE
ncbi:MAG: ABC transporter permease [Streptococcaceae bacterium]|jgi:simple sugar transport system permease protein|nr:ABC transporter permease [Streptococcaceae bacterium]